MMIRKTRHALALLLVLALSAGAAVAAEDPVTIGVLNSQSGSGADIAGKGSIEAARMAIEDVGGSVLGAPVKLLSADHQDKADIGLGIAKHWYTVDGVDAIFDVPNSSVALAVNGEAGRQKKLVIFSTGGSDRFTEEECNGYGLSWTYNSTGLARASVDAQIAKGRNTWFLITFDYAIGKNFDQSIRAELKKKGGEVLGTAFAPLGTSDFSSYIIQAVASGAKLIEVALSGQDQINAMKQLQEFAAKEGGQHIGNLVLIDTDVHAAGPAVFSEVESVVPFVWNRTPQTREFAQRFFGRIGKMPTMFQAGVYSSVRNYLEAVAAAGSKDTQAVLQAMRSRKIDDMFAQHATLRPNGLLTHDMYLVRVKAPADVKESWDFYDNLGVVPADQAYPPLSETKCPLIKQ